MENNLFTVKTAIVAGFTALGALLGWKGIMLLSWLLVMALDYLSGTLAACKAHSWSSSVAREGLWHKCGMILAVLVAGIADVVMLVIVQYIPIGMEWPGIIMPLVLAWYIITELGSILENAVKLGAKVPAWLIGILQATAELVDNVGEHATEAQGFTDTAVQGFYDPDAYLHREAIPDADEESCGLLE